MGEALRFSTGGVEETERIGDLLGCLLVPGDVVGLTGDLGAGKTAFVRGVARGAGVPAGHPVNSPTFTILNVYGGGRFPIFHLDLYRLDDPTELEGVGMSDLLSGQGVLLVEWAERYPEALPSDLVSVTIETTGPETRRFTVTAGGPMSRELVDELRASMAQAD
jgi:tRNA threonylcarbamoyladenosine biosynthesis protein TsaE